MNTDKLDPELAEETERLLEQQGHVGVMGDEDPIETWYSMENDLFESRGPSSYGLDQTTVLIVMAAGLVVGFLIGTFLIG